MSENNETQSGSWLEHFLYLSHRDLSSERKSRRLDLMSTILLSLAAVLSAFSAYQGSRWYSEMNLELAESGTLRDVAAKDDRNANRHILGDMMLFLEWANAYRNNDSSLMLVMEDRFSEPLKKAFASWTRLEKKGAAGLLPAGTPFGMKEYQLELQKESQKLVEESNTKFTAAKHAAQIGDDFIFSLVIFSLSLFFGAVCTKIGAPLYQIVLFWIGGFIAILGMTIIFQLPWNIGF